MPVNEHHPQYDNYLDVWRMTRDAAAGDAQVKSRAYLYLKTDFTESEPERWEIYKDRAYFLGVTGRTEKSMVGMVFRRPARFEVPATLEPILDDFNGCGDSIEQVAKDALSGLLQTRRHLFLVDHPEAEDGLSAKDQKDLGLRPTVASYPAESLINWRFEGIKGRKQLVMAVLVEAQNNSEDEFGHNYETVYRVLKLDSGVYTQQLFDEAMNPISEVVVPTDANRQPFDHIPLHGVRELEEPPLFSIAKVNLAHYRNVADLEDSAYTVGQPMTHIDIGSTSVDVWKENNPNGVQFGSRKGIVTQGGSITLVQAEENNLIRQTKLDKESEMIMLGAQLITRGEQAQTAEASRIQAGAESSVLDMLVNDLSEDLEASLKDIARFIGADVDSIAYELNTDYFDSGLSPQALMSVIQGASNSLYSLKDALYMIKTGRIEIQEGRTVEDIQADVAEQILLTGSLGSDPSM